MQDLATSEPERSRWVIYATLSVSLLATLWSSLIILRSANFNKQTTASLLPLLQESQSFEREILNARISFIYHVTLHRPGSLDSGWQHYQQAQADLARLRMLVQSSPNSALLRPRLDAVDSNVQAYDHRLHAVLNTVASDAPITPAYNLELKEWAADGNTLVNTGRDFAGIVNALAREQSDETGELLRLSSIIVNLNGVLWFGISLGLLWVRRRSARSRTASLACSHHEPSTNRQREGLASPSSWLDRDLSNLQITGRSVGGLLLMLSSIAVVLGTGGFALRSIEHLTAAQRASMHSQQVLIDAESLRTLATEAESDTRGFNFTGKPSLLISQQNEIRAAWERFDRLSQDEAEDPAASGDLQSLRQALQRRFDWFQQVSSVRQSSGPAAAARLVAPGSSLDLKHSLEDRISDIESRNNQLLVSGTIRSSHAAIMSKTLILFAAFPAAIGLCVLGLFTVHLLTRGKLLQRRLRGLNDTLKTILETAPVGIISLEPDHKLGFWNAAAGELFQIDQNSSDIGSAAVSSSLASLMSEVDQRFESTWVDRATTSLELQSDGSNGRRTVQIWAARVSRGEGERSEIVAIAQDMTEQSRMQELLAYQAGHDSLTGLPNRLALDERMLSMLQRADLEHRHCAVLGIDLDHFKQINDRFGHEAGDLLLTTIAKRMSSVLRRTDTLVRVGGDEFLCLAEAVHSAADAEVIAAKLIASLSEPIDLGRTTVRASISIGIALYPFDGTCTEELRKNADAALYRAKAAGRNQFRRFEESEGERRLESIRECLRSALEEQRFHLLYQAQYTAEGKLRGMEALLRLTHPTLGPISPAEFIPLAEQSQLIVPIGSWVLQQACTTYAAWLQQGLSPGILAVNVSAAQFASRDFSDQIARLLEQARMDPGCLELELTESMVMADTREAGQQMHRLEQYGVRLAIDDFGTGYSSLSHLNRLPIGTLKIDRSFIQHLDGAKTSRPIVEAVVALGKTLSMEVIAEGVETETQRAFLSDIGCDSLQGFLFTVPVEESVAESLLIREKSSLLGLTHPEVLSRDVHLMTM